ncbi:MAG: substrate-binding domain-containing protein, partial [Cyanobacteria bacterium P01_A01_bin.68]
SYKEDLESLGLIAFYLWLGRTTNHHTGKKIDPAEHELLPDTDNQLKQFIYRLLGFDAAFKDADTARQALLQMSLLSQDDSAQPFRESQENQKRFPLYKALLGLLALLLIGGGLWYYFWQRRHLEESKYIAWNQLLANFSEVNNVPPGTFLYSSEKNATWSFTLSLAPEDENRLNNLLTQPKPEVEAIFKHIGVDIKNNNKILIEEIRNGQKSFAITSLENIITNDMNKKKIAYDGLLVFVTFNKNDNSLPKALGGKISLQQLRQIYTGRVTNWKQIAPNLPSLPIEPYVPKEKEAVEKFKQLVLQNNRQDIALFEDKIAQFKTEDTEITQQKMRQAISKREETGKIGFGILNKTWNQCAGYPLAILNRNNQPVQPLFRIGKRVPINPSDDLCDKANYFNVEAFRSDKTISYPLGYHLYLVYPKDNSRELAGSVFADMLRTRRGQCLLYKVGLVPLQPIPDTDKNNNTSNNACESVSKPNL